MKSSSMNTHMGNIAIDNEVIARYAGSVAMECFGIVGMAGINMKDGLVKLLKMDSITRGINVSIKNNIKCCRVQNAAYAQLAWLERKLTEKNKLDPISILIKKKLSRRQ